MDTLRVAVVEDSFAARNYQGENIEYYVTPLTTVQELKAALYPLKPDVVLLGEDSSPFDVAPILRGLYPLLLVSESADLHKWRRAVSVGMKGTVPKPVTREKIVRALGGQILKPQEQRQDNVVYIETGPEKTHGPKIPKAPRRLPETPELEQVQKEVRKEARLVPLSGGQGRLVTFFNTKGGVGKTLYSINVAAHVARLYPSKRVALVDFDLDFGDVANFLGLEPKITALSWQYIPDENLERAGVDGYLMKHKSGIWVLPAPIPPIDEEVFTFRVANKVLAALKKNFDLVVVDLGPTLRDVVVVTLEHADRVYVVTTANISSLRNAYDLVRIFEGLKIEPARIRLLLNSFKRSVDPNEIRKYIPYEIVLKVPYIKQVEELNDSYELSHRNKRFGLYLDDLVLDIMGKEPPKKGFFSFLERRR